MASLTSFSLLYVDTARFLNHHLDDWLRREEASLKAMPADALPHQVERHAQFDTGQAWPIALYDRTGHERAGEPVPLPADLPADGQPFVFRAPAGGQLHRFRGIVEHLADGSILLISERLWWASQLDHVLIERTVWGLGIAAALGLGTAAMLGARAQRRIASFTKVAQRIVSGDLSGRLPIRNQSDDLDRLAIVVNGMLDHIERLVLQVAAFRDAVAHDLSNPLARLHVTLEATRAKAESLEDYASGVDTALHESRRLSRMLAAVRRLSDIESGARRAGFAPVDLDILASEAYEFYQPVADEHGISLRLCSLGQRCDVLGDHDLLFEAIGNLLDNAIKFTPPGGRVNLTVFQGPEPGFEVADNGPGIPAAEQTAVLRRFYRPEGSRAIAGSGLGLALVSAIADLHEMSLIIGPQAPGCVITLRRHRRAEPAGQGERHMMVSSRPSWLTGALAMLRGWITSFG